MINSIWVYPLIIFTGALAGFINTLAGNGSAVVLPVLVALGVPPTVANGTNRVGIVVQCIVGYKQFKQKGMVYNGNTLWLILPTLLGAGIGASIAVNLNESTMQLLLGILMLILLALVLLQPKQWLRQQALANVHQRIKSPKMLLIMFAIGLHGGFIQAGVGIMIIAALVLGAGLTLLQASGTKLLIALCFTSLALAIFIYNKQVHWQYAALLTIGQGFGTWAATNFATKVPNANLWVRRLLIIVIIAAAIRFFEIYKWFI